MKASAILAVSCMAILLFAPAGQSVDSKTHGNTCSTGGAPATAITPVLVGNGPSTFRLYQIPGASGGSVYMSWSLGTNTMQMGADMFGTEVVLDNGVVFHSTAQGGHCNYIGHSETAPTIWIDAGGVGFANSNSYSVTNWWSNEWGVQGGFEGKKVTGGAHFTRTWGEDESFGTEYYYDSESLFKQVIVSSATAFLNPDYLQSQ